MSKNIFKEIKYIPGQFGYSIHIVLSDGFVAYDQIYPDSKSDLVIGVKQAVEDFLEWDGRSREVDRVYSTRIDCMVRPEGVWRAA